MKLPSMTKVTSSNVASLGHHDGRLYVRFIGGRLYSYADVPRALYDEALKAPSVGRWFHSKISGKFKHTPIEEQPHGASHAHRHGLEDRAHG